MTGNIYASVFLGVAFLGVAFFVAAAFLGAAFFAPAFAAGALLLVTRPDLVLPRTLEASFSTAGAAAAFLGLLALAFALGAAAFLVVVAFAAVFLGAAGFFAVVALAFYDGSVRSRKRSAGMTTDGSGGGLLGLCGGGGLLLGLGLCLLGLSLLRGRLGLLLRELHGSRGTCDAY